MSYNKNNIVFTVAKREVQLAFRSKAIMISLAVVLAVLVVGILVLSVLRSNVFDSEKKLAVVGGDASQYVAAAEIFKQQAKDSGMELVLADIDVVLLKDRNAAKKALADQKIAAAVIHKANQQVELLYEKEPDQQLYGLVSAVVNRNAQAHAFSQMGIDSAEFAKLTNAATLLTTTTINPKQQTPITPAVITVLAAVSIMSFFVLLFAGNIGGRVADEKSSRIVEIIISAVKPQDFLTGKLLGNTVFGLVSSAAIFSIATVLLVVTGFFDFLKLELSLLPLLLLSFVLALLLFGSLYAAAGSMVARIEDLQATQSPILLLSLAMVYTPLFGWYFLDSVFMQVVAWIPPFSFTVAPLHFAAGTMSLWQVLAAYALACALIVLILQLVARIYRNAIIYNGGKLSWLKAAKHKGS